MTPTWYYTIPYSQCFFRAASPCVMSNSIMGAATNYKLLDSDTTGASVSYEGIFKIRKFLNSTSPLFLDKFRSLAKDLVAQIPPDDPRTPFFESALKNLEAGHSQVGTALHTASMLYFLRPNSKYYQQLSDIMKTNLEASTIESSGTVIGMPIRASDKCKMESSCLTLDDYMALAKVTWDITSNSTSTQSHIQSQPPVILITTESPTILSKVQAMEKQTDGWFQLATNRGDLDPPGSGRFSQKQSAVPADKAMLAAMSTLQLQLSSSILHLNCCSGFHRIIKEFSLAGAGALANAQVNCLSESTDLRFRICCYRSKLCLRQREEHMAKLKSLAANETM
jgi:hypothetical protein